MIDPDDIEQVRAALRQILAWVDRGKRPTYGDLTAVDWYTLALLPRPDVEEMAGGPLSELSRLTTLRPLSELTEADGEVLWWRADPHEGVRPDWPPPRPEGVVELEGSTLWRNNHYPESVDVSWAIGHDYFTPLPKVRKPDGARIGGG